MDFIRVVHPYRDYLETLARQAGIGYGDAARFTTLCRDAIPDTWDF